MTALRRLARAQGVAGCAGALMGIAMDPGGLALPSWPDIEGRVERGRRTEPVFFPSISEYPVIDEFAHAVRATDRIRTGAFRTALDQVARGRRVLEIDTSRDAIWARYAADRGASSVVAVTGGPPSRLAPRRHPGRDRIARFDGQSTDLLLREPADVCVSTTIGAIAGSAGAAAILNDARSRLTRPGAAMIPVRACTMASAVCARDIAPGMRLSPLAPPYLDELFRLRDTPFDARMCLSGVTYRHLVSSTGIVEDLDFASGTRTEGNEAVVLVVADDARIDGLLLWLRLWTYPGAPPVDTLTRETTWIPVYVPIFAVPVEVAHGDIVEVDFSRTLSMDGIHPDYAALVTVRTARGAFTEAVELPYQPTGFRSTWFHRLLFSRGTGTR
ncbi:hypothetical protein O7605_20765 [Verrucosispora sp. WMMA2121]|uniref:hypothetical protein n=1 Tax=Verrucosispora sp. WMMA2121 TaxID=3015164 RepID=UPI0022B74AEA|nr:hypothetical protein [Verrucosispora sp. WMMA2121]MCZ7421935.1 hypothetical protein [Verrucosispora sp. WMMA2121]